MNIQIEKLKNYTKLDGSNLKLHNQAMHAEVLSFHKFFYVFVRGGGSQYLVPKAYLCIDSTSQVGSFLIYKQARM